MITDRVNKIIYLKPKSGRIGSQSHYIYVFGSLKKQLVNDNNWNKWADPYLIYIKYTFKSKLLILEKFFNIFLNETDRIFYAANSRLPRLDSPFVL